MSWENTKHTLWYMLGACILPLCCFEVTCASLVHVYGLCITPSSRRMGTHHWFVVQLVLFMQWRNPEKDWAPCTMHQQVHRQNVSILMVVDDGESGTESQFMTLICSMARLQQSRVGQVTSFAVGPYFERKESMPCWCLR
jgi:hypothetical protein